MKNFKIITSVVLIAFTILFSDCSIKKRSYRVGYFISWNKKVVTHAKAAAILKHDTQIDPWLTSSAAKMDVIVLKKKAIKPLIIKPDTCGDIITLHNGEERVGQVLEINPKTVKYKLCNDPDGPMITMNVEDVFMVKYTSGAKEVFKKEEKKSESNSNISVLKREVRSKEHAEYSGFAIASIATAILACTIILSPLPFILGIAGLNQISENPEKYKGTGMAAVGMVVGGLGVFVLLLLIITVLL